MDTATFGAIKERLHELGAVDQAGLNEDQIKSVRKAICCGT